MQIKLAYDLLVLAAANYIKAVEEHNLPEDELTKEGDFDAQYVSDRLDAELDGTEFFQNIADKLNATE